MKNNVLSYRTFFKITEQSNQIRMTQTKPIISIVNVVASASIDQRPDLEDITKKFLDAEWHPDVFPGAVFRLKKPKDCHIAIQIRKDDLHWSKIRRVGKNGSKNSSSKVEKG